MKTIITLSLLPIIVLAYFFSEQLYIAAKYFPAYVLIAISLFLPYILSIRPGPCWKSPARGWLSWSWGRDYRESKIRKHIGFICIFVQCI